MAEAELKSASSAAADSDGFIGRKARGAIEGESFVGATQEIAEHDGRGVHLRRLEL